MLRESPCQSGTFPFEGWSQIWEEAQEALTWVLQASIYAIKKLAGFQTMCKCIVSGMHDTRVP